MKDKNEDLFLPYGDIYYQLLQSIHQALWYCYCFEQEELTNEIKFKNYQRKYLDEKDKKLESLFKVFEKWYRPGLNKHISKGLAPDPQKKFGIFPRISKIIIQAFNDAQVLPQKANSKATVLPSPLFIMHQILTVSSEAQTGAYPLVLCRSMLFIFLGLHPNHPDIKNDEIPDFKSKYPNLEVFTEKEVLESIASFANYIKIQLRWPDKRKEKKRRRESKSVRINYLVGHFLALKGFAHLWFLEETNSLTRESVKQFCDFPLTISLEKVIEKYRQPEYRFRLSQAFTDLPEQGEIINSLFGIPIPLRGAETIFYGGLKKTSTGGIVVNLSGKPGAGKTSIALSIAALFSPFNTRCIYISMEEDREDLFTRLISLVPSYLKELSIYRDPKSIDDNDWFNVTKLSGQVSMSVLTDMLKFLAETIDNRKKFGNNYSVPSICPLIIVIDNINELLAGFKNETEDYNSLEEFIYQCRKLGAIVVLISAEELPSEIRLDYLVDISIHVKQSGTESEKEKPIRILKLSKTRHQISRQGSHVFHLLGSVGFRICPQIPSQMDKKEIFRKLLPDKTRIIPALNLVKNENGFQYETYLNIFPKSLILIHGYGSSGKAGFALKLLLTPSLTIPDEFQQQGVSKMKRDILNKFFKKIILKSKTDFGTFAYNRKILVVSFLYPEEYYKELIAEKINPSLKSIFKGLKNPKKIEVISYSPGYLTPEDFINKIIRYLDEAILEGEPYTGVLLDGLHNVLLQFKNLQENDMVWPLLYNILARYNLTIVTTFTNFSIPSHSGDHGNSKKYSSHISEEDQLLMRKGQAPFLHTLVKAADFYLNLDEEKDQNNKKKYVISVNNAIYQDNPSQTLEWDRQSLEVTHKSITPQPIAKI